uniref:TFIIS N-terminal domain-containing protein n=1 Tax=Panagrellus redivivus TaxID=6233 RepID=A0A7E4ZTN5_PANRE
MSDHVDTPASPQAYGPPDSPDFAHEYADAPQSPDFQADGGYDYGLDHQESDQQRQQLEYGQPQSPTGEYDPEGRQSPANDGGYQPEEPQSPAGGEYEPEGPQSPDYGTEYGGGTEVDGPASPTGPASPNEYQPEAVEEHQETEEAELEESFPASRVVLSDDSDDEGETSKEPKVDSIMANIFGEASDDEGGEDDVGDDHEPRVIQDDEEDEHEWDFDRIMEEKKRERKKNRKRRKDGSIDLCSNADGQIRHVVELMKNAAADDRESNNQRRPAIQKTKLLEVVRSMLLRADFYEALIDNDMMSAISEWLAPLPDKSLPSLAIRTTLLKILDGFPQIEPSVLKQSGLGKAVMMIFKHPKECKDNKIIASKLIRNWSQPIFQISNEYSAVSREEREAFDFEHMPEVKRRRLEAIQRRESAGGPSSSMRKRPAPVRDADEQAVLNPGDPGFINRARVPRQSTSAYIIRPKSNVEGNFRGPTKNRQNSRFDKAAREFKERTKTSKAARAVGVSIEGRRMD